MPTKGNAMSVENYREAMRELAVKAQNVAKDEQKSISEKRTEMERIQSEIKDFSDKIYVTEQAASLAAGMSSGDAGEKGAPQEKAEVKHGPEGFVTSKGFQDAADAIRARKRVEFGMEIGTKAAVTVAEGASLSGGFPSGIAGTLAMPDYLPGIVPILYAPCLVQQLLGSASTSTSSVSYVQQSAETIAAAGVAEGGAKPYADTTLVRKYEQVGKVAVLEKITDELLADVPAVQSFLQNLLTGQVQREWENAVLNGTGYPEVQGLLQRTGLQTAIASEATGTLATPSLVIEDIFEQITAIRFNAFVEPNAIVMNPTDWSNIRKAKDANGQYYAGGPFSNGSYGQSSAPNVYSLWELPVVVTPRIAAGKVLVGDFKSATLFHRQGITVDMTNSNVNDFENNLVTLRVEARQALVVPRPQAFGTTTITWA